jgi:hypothetical protein
MERTADARTVFRITIPGRPPQGSVQDQNQEEESDDKPTHRPFVSLNNERASENSIRHSDT